MAFSRNLEVLELSGLRLDQPLIHCGELSPSDVRLASEARFHAVQSAFQSAIDRHVDLVVLHSEILSERSAGGRAPWFLNRLIETCDQRGTSVVWAERQHNAWMGRFVSSPSTLIRMVPGEVRNVSTDHGFVLLRVGSTLASASPLLRDDACVKIGIDMRAGSRLGLEDCDLVLHERTETRDAIEDFVAAARENASQPMAQLHTLRPDRSNTREVLAVSSLGFVKVSCSLSANLDEAHLAEHLTEEVDAAAGRYFADHPQTQLLVTDLAVSGHGTVWGSLWNSEQRQWLQSELTRLSRHPGCRVRTITPLADGTEASRVCAFAPVVNSIWAEATERPAHAVRSLADLAPTSIAMSDWDKDQGIPVNHALASEVRHACLHQLRSAS